MIIKDADFSENAVKNINPNPQLIWGIDGRDYEDIARTQALISVAPFTPVDYENLWGKVVRKVRLIPYSAGIISLLKGTALGEPAPVVETLTVTAEMVAAAEPVEFDVNIPIVENEILMISARTDDGTFKFVSSIGSGILADFWMNSTSSGYSRASSGPRLTVSFGYYE